MDVLDCGHVARRGSGRMCRQIAEAVAADKSVDYVRWLTGEGLAYDLLCSKTCDAARQAGQEVELVEVCEGCFDRFQDDYDDYQWRGQPGIPIRDEPCDPTVSGTPLPTGLASVTDFAPLPTGGGASNWLLLVPDGGLWKFDADTGQAQLLAQCTVADESAQAPWAGHTVTRHLHVSTDGAFAAVVNDYARYGQVVDLAAGVVTLDLDGGTHHQRTVPFSLAFTEHDGRTVVVHRTDWNRLDVSDAATGTLLTDRGPTSYSRGEEGSEHDLDYFHGALFPSPTGRWMADDGWVWSPVGMPRIWDLKAWLSDHVWESDRDSPSEKYLVQRSYHWDSPMCWIADGVLAISGIGNDDVALLPGVRVLDFITGTEVSTFAGPAGPLFARGRRLYSADRDALRIWDPYTGELTGIVPLFHPTRMHPTTGELAGVRDGVLTRWPIPAQDLLAADPAQRVSESS